MLHRTPALLDCLPSVLASPFVGTNLRVLCLWPNAAAETILMESIMQNCINLEALIFQASSRVVSEKLDLSDLLPALCSEIHPPLPKLHTLAFSGPQLFFCILLHPFFTPEFTELKRVIWERIKGLVRFPNLQHLHLTVHQYMEQNLLDWNISQQEADIIQGFLRSRLPFFMSLHYGTPAHRCKFPGFV
jgi:hypothetical protein